MLLINDYSRMTRVTFFREKYKAFERFRIFKSMVENQVDVKIKCLRSDRGREITSNEFDNFCEKYGIRRHFYAPRTPQHNGVVERKNRTVIEMVRTMMKYANLANVYWKEVHTIVYILNRVHIRVNHTKIPYELWNGRPHTMKCFKIFGSKCYIRRDENDLGKFDTRVDEGIFLGYDTNTNAYRCYNKSLDKIVESTNVKVCETWDQTAPKHIQETKFEVILVVVEEKIDSKDNNEEETYEIEEFF